MLERIIENEERLDLSLQAIKELEIALNNFKDNNNNIKLLNKYYGSKKWFKDKEAYENNEIEHIKAGVLSEDSVWNMNEDIRDLINTMQKIVKSYRKSI